MTHRKHFSLYKGIEDQGYGNNRCSGYALVPVFVNEFNKGLLEENNGNSMGILLYESLCSCQRAVLNSSTKRNESDSFLNSPLNRLNGTQMILPSAIVIYCYKRGLSPKIIYSSQRDSIFGTNVFEEDCTRMVNFLCPVDNYDAIEQEAVKYRYLIALTRFKHWVSLQSTAEGYYLYDPAPKEYQGGIFGPGGFRDLLPEKKGKYKFFYDILIGLLPTKNM